jgi:hypothetical protein
LYHFFIQIFTKGFRQLYRLMMLDPTKKDVECETDEGTSTDPLRFIFPKNTDGQWKKNDS